MLRLKLELIPAKRCVKLTHTRFRDPQTYFAEIARLAARRSVDYLDGTVFRQEEMYVTTGEFADEAPFVSDYTCLGIYYRSIPQKPIDYLTARDYIWRWDTDWFWCSKHFHVQNTAIRLLAGKWALNSRTYQRLMRLSQKVLPRPRATEPVIQDVAIPVENAVEFLDFLLREVGIKPVWICPFRSRDPDVTYDLYSLDPQKLYINFGFWDSLPARPEEGYYNKLIERKALELDGKKGLYSTACYDRETFWKIHNQERYDALKAKYDPEHAFKDLYEKCVERK